ncbi:MAG: DUF7666 domain-containing protein [bacterium]
MIAYKGTTNQKCINFTYEPGKTYTFKGKLEICKRGFHFCKEFEYVNAYYEFSDKNTQMLEIEVIGDIIDEGKKSVTNKMKVLRIIPKSEWSKLSKNKVKFDKNKNLIYEERKNGDWKKYEYDKNNNQIYEEHANRYWKKQKFDKNNNLIYFKNSNGCKKYKYNKNNNKIYQENSNGIWKKLEYDENNNMIYFENSNGYWIKSKFDENNNLIYEEDSDGNQYSITIE